MKNAGLEDLRDARRDEKDGLREGSRDLFGDWAGGVGGEEGGCGAVAWVRREAWEGCCEGLRDEWERRARRSSLDPTTKMGKLARDLSNRFVDGDREPDRERVCKMLGGINPAFGQLQMRNDILCGSKCPARVGVNSEVKQMVWRGQ